MDIGLKLKLNFKINKENRKRREKSLEYQLGNATEDASDIASFVTIDTKSLVTIDTKSLVTIDTKSLENTLWTSLGRGTKRKKKIDEAEREAERKMQKKEQGRNIKQERLSSYPEAQAHA
ncbi:hypothetical protein EV359DRAFT_87809 [Lentinula novae-zelandiae]|nr:hypothetical protein EV359DRAFT_87809 [Lentinula novae-zelandiae]